MNTCKRWRIFNRMDSSTFSMMQIGTMIDLTRCCLTLITLKTSPRTSFTNLWDMPSDKKTVSHLKTSLKTIGTHIFALSYVEFLMKQEPSQLFLRQIKRKRKLALNQVCKIVFLTQQSITWTRRFFKFKVFTSNLRRR
jgi:hypothetical protein